MQQSMGGRDAAYIRRWVAEQVQHRRGSGGPVHGQEVIDALVDHLQPLEDLDVESVVRVVARVAYDSCSRARSRGLRRSERTRDADGIVVDVPAEQLLIPQLRQVGERKIAHGEASMLDGHGAVQVADAAEHLARAQGRDPSVTFVGDVLTHVQIVEIRGHVARAA